jgi:hypothetical protein
MTQFPTNHARGGTVDREDAGDLRPLSFSIAYRMLGISHRTITAHTQPESLL